MADEAIVVGTDDRHEGFAGCLVGFDHRQIETGGPESVSNIERGRQLPTIETLVDLGRELAVPLPDFLDGVAGSPGLSRERVQQEARLREVARGLSDRDLRLALTLAEVMTGR